MRLDVTDALYSISVLALARGEHGMVAELQKLAKKNEKPYNKYGHFLTEWHTRLNNAEPDTMESWLVESIRENLPVAERAVYREDPGAFEEEFRTGLARIKEEADEKGLRNGMFLRFMRQALKIREMFT